MSTLDISIGSACLGRIEAIGEHDFRFVFNPLLQPTATTPILGLYLEGERPRTIEASGHLPLWFEHLLPPPHSRLRRLLCAQCNIGDDALDESFRLLAFLGDDLPGAVIARPDPGAVEWVPPRTEPLRRPTEGQLRSALAGQQSKLSVRAGERGLVIPALGEASSFIAKFPDPEYPDLPRIEIATMSWARAAGIATPSFRLASIDEFDALPGGTAPAGSSAFLIERFDRSAQGERLHMEDFAQVLDCPLGSIHDGRFEHLVAVVAAHAPDDLEELCRRLVFCLLSGNGDAHLKNWSLLYQTPRTPSLSPAYDLVSTILVMKDDTLSLSVGGKRRFDELGLFDFAGIARVARRDEAEIARWVKSAIERIRDAFEDPLNGLDFTAAERETLRRHARLLPLVRA